ncbi:uncharacterized protein AMSG_02291 [Thecamonas trahens ATCC 50062]|uniref:Uncharacterized protein n=1 Tax=Thecamonas trahens ATCC 50062 TaxID=461836 RepID=A0A0L0DVW8_THETB|nr:hypothetical protein AMSG_02291 [Thecamonas trahens ATCC 50062]KNC56322.1 hypothetical protein AMSG_02291 [Thecamonas trahens ATCC 50062]|eukprot:XP_013760839.1 hypothetical protein AMSG_02291 [Thecamonas trahens ATCC 50062]
MSTGPGLPALGEADRELVAELQGFDALPLVLDLADAVPLALRRHADSQRIPLAMVEDEVRWWRALDGLVARAASINRAAAAAADTAAAERSGSELQLLRSRLESAEADRERAVGHVAELEEAHAAELAGLQAQLQVATAAAAEARITTEQLKLVRKREAELLTQVKEAGVARDAAEEAARKAKVATSSAQSALVELQNEASELRTKLDVAESKTARHERELAAAARVKLSLDATNASLSAAHDETREARDQVAHLESVIAELNETIDQQRSEIHHFQIKESLASQGAVAAPGSPAGESLAVESMRAAGLEPGIEMAVSQLAAMKTALSTLYDELSCGRDDPSQSVPAPDDPSLPTLIEVVAAEAAGLLADHKRTKARLAKVERMAKAAVKKYRKLEAGAKSNAESVADSGGGGSEARLVALTAELKATREQKAAAEQQVVKVRKRARLLLAKHKKMSKLRVAKLKALTKDKLMALKSQMQTKFALEQAQASESAPRVLPDTVNVGEEACANESASLREFTIKARLEKAKYQRALQTVNTLLQNRKADAMAADERAAEAEAELSAAQRVHAQLEASLKSAEGMKSALMRDVASMRTENAALSARAAEMEADAERLRALVATTEESHAAEIKALEAKCKEDVARAANSATKPLRDQVTMLKDQLGARGARIQALELALASKEKAAAASSAAEATLKSQVASAQSARRKARAAAAKADERASTAEAAAAKAKSQIKSLQAKVHALQSVASESKAKERLQRRVAGLTSKETKALETEVALLRRRVAEADEARARAEAAAAESSGLDDSLSLSSTSSSAPDAHALMARLKSTRSSFRAKLRVTTEARNAAEAQLAKVTQQRDDAESQLQHIALKTKKVLMAYADQVAKLRARLADAGLDDELDGEPLPHQ